MYIYNLYERRVKRLFRGFVGAGEAESEKKEGILELEFNLDRISTSRIEEALD
jgi:hypothetical protein